MNIKSRNQELAQANQLLLLQVAAKEKNVVELQYRNTQLGLENTRQQRFADKLILKDQKSVAKSAALKKIKNLHAFISQVNQHILRVKDEHQLFRNACRIAIKFGGFKIAWIGLFKDDNRVINCVEQIGMPDEDTHHFKNLPISKNGPNDILLKTGKHMIFNDMSSDRQFDRWKSTFDKKNIQSYMILPISRSGEIIGTFNLYACELHYFKKAEVDLVKEVTDDISFALNIFEKEKKQQFAEQLVVANEKRYRLLIEKSTDIKLLITLKRKVIYSSPSLKSALGYTKEELVNQDVSQIIPPGDQKAFKMFMAEVISQPGKSFHFQQQFLHVDGHSIWCEGMMTNMLHEPGLNGLMANFRNISEKKLAEQEREFDKNNLTALINNTSDLMWSLDEQLNLITSNLAFDLMVKGMSGKKIERGSPVLGKGFSKDQLKKYKKYYHRVLAGEAFTETEYTPKPVEFWSNISYSPIRKDNEIIGAACHAHDITDIKLFERKLVQSESRLKEAQAISHLGNFEIDLVSQTEVWSDEMYNLYGIQKDDVTPSTGLGVYSVSVKASPASTR